MAPHEYSAEALEAEALWPSPDYFHSLERLKQALGSPVYIAEVNITAINLGVKLSDTPLRILSIVDFPEPDPQKHLCPHILILEDGRGLNLGHIARISIQAFSPSPEQLLYENRHFTHNMLFAPRTLSHESIQATSTAFLVAMFGDQPGRLLESSPPAESLEVPKTKSNSPKRLKN